MAILPIITAPDPLLKKHCEPVQAVGDDENAALYREKAQKLTKALPPPRR